MTIKDFFNPVTISAATNSSTKPSSEIKSDKSIKNAFTQNLQQALGSTQTCVENNTQLKDENSLSGSSLTSGVIDIGLGLATGNILSSGVNSAAILQKLMNQDISAQFTQLGLAVTSNFLAGLAGQDSATEIANTTEIASTAQSLTSADNGAALAAGSVTESAESALKDKVKSTINRTINWPIQNMHSEALLKKDETKGTDAG